MNSFCFNIHFLLGRNWSNVCRQTFSCLRGMTSGGHFSGNWPMFFMPHNISSSKRMPIVWSWQGATRKQIGCYIKFAIMTSVLVSRRKKEWEWKKERGWRQEKLEKGDFQGRIQFPNGVSRRKEAELVIVTRREGRTAYLSGGRGLAPLLAIQYREDRHSLYYSTGWVNRLSTCSTYRKWRLTWLIQKWKKDS